MHLRVCWISLQAEDRWSRPVMTRTGPDGALWVVDMYRYMIEHPEWLPHAGREELLPHYRIGDDKGRIYRISRKETKPRPLQNLKHLNTQELVTLSTPAMAGNETKFTCFLFGATMKLRITQLNHLLNTTKNPMARVHALWLLQTF
jgi:hypothetical protein